MVFIWLLSLNRWKSRWLSCHWSCRWLVLDTDSKDLVTVHTDGNEQLSVMCYGPGNCWLCVYCASVFPFVICKSPAVCLHWEILRIIKRRQNLKHTFFLSSFLFYLDGNFLAIGSHDNYIYIYAVAENGRKYSRVGKCSVSTCIYNPPPHQLFLVPPRIIFIFSSLLSSIFGRPLCTLCPHRVLIQEL